MLTKAFQHVYVPPVVGRPAAPETTVCPPPPPYGPSPGGPSGHWETRCETPCIFVGNDDEGSPIYLCGVPVCRTVWVRTG